jgi:hypothetical protein
MSISVSVTESTQTAPHGLATLTRPIFSASCNVNGMTFGQSASSYFGSIAGLSLALTSAGIVDEPIAVTFESNVVMFPSFRNIAAPQTF